MTNAHATATLDNRHSPARSREQCPGCQTLGKGHIFQAFWLAVETNSFQSTAWGPGDTSNLQTKEFVPLALAPK